MKATKLSVVIPTYNEELNIRDCIESVQWAEEILVVDAHSTDSTLEICQESGVKVIPFLGNQRFCEPQRWVGIQQAQHDWVLCIDADERPSIPLSNEIRLLMDSNSPYAGFEIPFRHFFFGRHMKYGGLAHNYLLRLVRQGFAYYPDGGFVHEQLHVRGNVGRLQNPILHYGTRDLRHYLEKSNHYSSLTAQKLFKKGKRITYANAPACFVVKPLYYFVKRCFFQRGFMDGKYGLVLAFLTAMTVTQNHLKLFELQEKAKGNVDSKGDG